MPPTRSGIRIARVFHHTLGVVHERNPVRIALFGLATDDYVCFVAVDFEQVLLGNRHFFLGDSAGQEAVGGPAAKFIDQVLVELLDIE